jgi:hypothetical protein
MADLANLLSRNPERAVEMRKYADDYEIEITEDAKGREKKVAVYRGAYYEIAANEKQIKTFRLLSILLTLVTAALHIAGGFVANQGMYQFYVALPYVIAFLPLYFLAAGVFRLPNQKRLLRRDEYGLSFERMKKASISLLVLLLVGVLGEIVFLIFFAAGDYSREIIYLFLEIFAALGVYVIFWQQKRMGIALTSAE